MAESRVDALVAKLEKGRLKTNEIFNAFTPAQWQLPLYPDPPWQIRHLLAHFVSAESQLLALAQNVAGGGPGSPPDYDYDTFNAAEQIRLEGLPPAELIDILNKERLETIAWIRTLDTEHLDKIGQHPVLGQVNVETLIISIYGHQLLHMRELSRALTSVV